MNVAGRAAGVKRGALLGKGRVNLQKAAEIVMNEFRAGTIGRVSLETPEEFAQWLAAGEQKDAQREARKAARKKARGKGASPADDAAPASQ